MAEAPTLITVTMNTAIDRVLIVPGFKAGSHLRAEVVSHSPAGKGVNVARALARLGQPVTATGFVGKSEAEQFATSLQSSENSGRIKYQLIPVPGRTRENITIVDPDTHTDTHLRTRGYTVSPADLSQLSTRISQHSRTGVIVIFTGSLPTGMDDGALIELITTAQQAGARVVLDLNGQTLAAVLSSLTQPAWMVSPNRTEFAEAVGLDAEASEDALLTAARRVSQQAGWMLVSLGGDGALIVTESGTFKGRCHIQADRVINTVSAGDCLLAGVLDARQRGLSPQVALSQGLAVATASTFHHSPARFEQRDVDDLLQTISVETL